jgi:hypothetical protein
MDQHLTTLLISGDATADRLAVDKDSGATN